LELDIKNIGLVTIQADMNRKSLEWVCYAQFNQKFLFWWIYFISKFQQGKKNVTRLLN